MPDAGSSGPRRPLAGRVGAHLPDVRDRVQTVARQVGSVPERSARFRQGVRLRARRLRHPRSTIPGLLSIVVPLHNVADYVVESIASVRFQEYADIEIIVVDDESTDGSGKLARSIARRDPRVRVVSRPNGGPSAARNTGVTHARGEFLAFFDPDDMVSPAGYRRAVESLRESGSDFAVLSYDRVQNDRRTGAADWIRQAHAVRRQRCTLADYPDAMVNAVPWSKVYRRAFYDRAQLSFPEGALYEDQPMTAAAYAKAEAFDVLPDILVSWRIRGDQSSITQNASSVANLQEQVNATAASLAVLDEHAGTDIGDIRATQLLAYNMPVFTRNMLNGDREFYEVLRATVLELLERGENSAYFHKVPALSKVLNRMIADDRYDDAAELISSDANRVNRYPTEQVGEWFLSDFPVPGGIAPEYRRLADGQLDLVARAIRTSLDEERLTIGGWAFIRNIDLASFEQEVAVTLVGPGGRRVPLEVAQHEELRVDLATFHWYCDVRPAGFTATLDLAGVVLEAGTWRVEVAVSAAGIDRVGLLAETSTAGSAGRSVTVVRDGIRWSLRRDGGAPVLRIDPVRVHWVDAEPAPGGIRVTVSAEACDELRLASFNDRVFASVRVSAAGDGRWTAVLPTDRATFPFPLMPSRLLAVIDGEEIDVVTNDLPRYPGRPVRGANGPHVIAGGSGAVRLATKVLCATDVTMSAEDLVVEITGDLPEDGPIVLASNAETIRGVAETAPEGRLRLRFPLRRTFWGHEDLVVPQGTYTLMWQRPRSDDPFPIRPAAEFWDRLPLEDTFTTAEIGLEVAGGNRHPLLVQVRPPLEKDERGSRNQRLLREWALETRTDEDAIFFRSLYGEVTNCNSLGVHTELARRGSGLTKYWSIADNSVPVPPGGVGIVENTRAWHAAIASARYHMVNVHQLVTWTKSPGQIVIQTMHGYPYKQMGHDLWSARRYFFTAEQVASYDRRAREWDYFVSPATYATPLLEAAFLAPAHSEAEVLEIGYPRNDILQSGEADKVRTATRELLGIAPHQKAVLYAPTYRDYLSSDDLTADRVDFLNAERASRLLGPDYVLLMRGHAFNTRKGERLAAHPQIIDVSDHPDINDLILASDVGILDYSSLRFDYALTDKPMIFLVPDLAQYDAARPGIIDFPPTAPGPMVSTTREVVDLLRDLNRLADQYAGARVEFRKRFADLDDGHASERLVDAVMVPRGDAPPSD